MQCLLFQQPSLLAKELDELSPQCGCEGCHHGPHGPIAPDEKVIRFLVPPQHWDEKKNIPKSQSLSHAETTGMSVYRLNKVTDEELLLAAKILIERKRKTNKNFGLKGILVIEYSILKSISKDKNPCYCIYDTARHDRPSHADIFQRTANCTDEVVLERRRELFQLVKQNVISVAKFKGGLLSPWAAS